MPKFCCKHCGMITDKPEIESKGRVKAGYKEGNYEYMVRCPVCLNAIFFYRPEPFPTDEPPEMKQERCDDEHCFLPKGHEGLHQAVAIITDKNNNIDLSSIPTRVI